MSTKKSERVFGPESKTVKAKKVSSNLTKNCAICSPLTGEGFRFKTLCFTAEHLIAVPYTYKSFRISRYRYLKLLRQTKRIGFIKPVFPFLGDCQPSPWI